MTRSQPSRLKPRKQPSQARSKVTVEAIFEASIQVLLHSGARGLTTGRVAERAGVSIGTLYQYFPGKEALLYALVSRHLDKANTAVETACQQHRGKPLADCSNAFVKAYLDAKIGHPEASRALYYASADLDLKDLADAMMRRLHQAACDLLGSAENTRFDDLDSVVFSWVAVVVGGTRQVFEGDQIAARLPVFREQLARLSLAYLQASASACQSPLTPAAVKTPRSRKPIPKALP